VKAQLIEHEFQGVRLQIDSELSYEEVLRRLHELTGSAPVPEFNAFSASVSSEEQFQRGVTERFVGPSDFMIFAEVDHGRWIEKYGIHRRALRIILGNPLIAITMIRHTIVTGLFAPVELLLVDNETGSGSTLHYVRPSSLIPIAGNAQLASAAKELDRKLHLLISNITGLE
jgi:uncharacterized protein (DUF302 family)